MDPNELGPVAEARAETGDQPGTEGPEAGGAAAGTSVLGQALSEVPDLILMFRVSPEGRLQCESAMSSRPTAPILQTLVGHAIDELVSRDVLERFGERYDEAASSRQAASYEETLYHGDSPLAVEATLTPIVDESGKPSHLFWSIRDLTEHRSASASLRETENRLEEAEERTREAEERTREAEERTREAEERVRNAEEQVRRAEEQVREAERGIHENEARARESEARLHEAEQQARKAEEQLREAEERVRATEARASEAEEEVRRAKERSREAEEEVQRAEERVRQAEERVREAEERVRQAEERSRETAESVQEEGLRLSEQLIREAEERVREAEERARRAEEGSRASQEQIASLVEGASIGIASTDAQGKVLHVNPAFCELLGRSREDLLSTSIAELAHEEDRNNVERLLSELMVAGSAALGTELRILHESGDVLWTRIDAVIVHEGEDERVVWQFQDQSDRRDLQERLAHHSLHDPLTGLPNRALFLDRLGRAVARLDREPTMVAALMLDLDRFDTINEAHGHQVGDRYLQGVAKKLENTIRQADSVARLGSDEFAIVAEGLESEDDAVAFAGRLLEAIADPISVEGTGLSLTSTVGLAITTSATEQPETLLRDAGLALARAKEQGPARVVVFDEALRAEAAKRLKTERELEQAIESGEFRVFFQPQVDLQSGTIVGTEVLARWAHPQRGLITPAEFIGLAEETGLIVRLGSWVLQEACEQSVRWSSLRSEPLRMWVNFSPRQLTEPKLAEMVEKVLAETGADAGSICIEVTEGVLLEEASSAVAALRDLKQLGLQIGIDDFGKGFSSLAYLKRLPVDMLKLDRTFVSGLGHNEDDHAIAAAIINLARAMDLTSIAEGVETPEQLAVLRELGCDLAQGYFFSNPQPAEVISELLGQNLRW